MQSEQVIRWMKAWAPHELALPKDPIGLLIGRADHEVGRILVTLDVLENVVDEAIEKKADLIIAHHPLIYHPLKEIRTDQTEGRLIKKIIQHDISVYAAHTNLDVAEGGISDMMASRLELLDLQILSPVSSGKLIKVVVFIPESHVEQVFQAMAEAGAGWIGNYSHCTFQTKGTGTFLPLEGTNPYLGKVGEVERVAEVRMETILPRERLHEVIGAMLAAHPYEEVAYDLYPLAQEGKSYGLGRIGRLKEPMSLSALAKRVKERFSLEGVRIVGERERLVRRVAVLGGSGRDLIKNAASLGADVYITGDIGYHDAHEAISLGLALIDGGHTMEKVMIDGVAAYLEQKAKESGAKVTVLRSEMRTDPFSFC